MKHLNLKAFAASALLLACGFGATAQDRNNDDEVVKLDARSSRFNYREGEIIVKFKQNSLVAVRSLKNGQFYTTGVKTLDAKLNSMGLFEAEPLMPLSGGRVNNGVAVKSLSGRVVNDNDMSKLYRLKFDTAKLKSVDDAITEIKSMAEVEYAEPNYLVYTLATDADAYSLDPLYSQQWGFDAINLPALWAMPKISEKRPVIAILDTGVEFTHLDLLNNIWTNEAEFSGSTGTDDDGNGFADDMYGWDFVNQNNRMDDYNGHGTHCAGIAAAVGCNGNGGVGANPDALIMPIAVLQSDGAGDIATLVKGIDYATANGADILSLSLGTYASSIALEQALAKAYQNAVIVAAAGNDGLCINPHKCPMEIGAPMYPAAYTFVLGVQATDKSGELASFSNYDCDGPLFSNPIFFGEEQLYNYELKAPGVSVMSTYPGGRYKALNGTSMACPLVAGAISRLLQCKEYARKEILFGDLIHAANGGNVNMLATYNITDADRKPNLRLVTYELNDTTGGDGDYRADAGETLEIYPTLRNDWGQAENIKISIDFGENEDLSIAQFIANNVDFGKPLSSYAKAKSANPIRIKLRDEIADGRRIKFVIKATCGNMERELAHEFTVTVENGVEIGGMVTEDMTLYPDVHYIVTKSIAVPDSVKLTIKPGTVLKFKAGTGMSFSKNAILDCVGTPDSMITFTVADGENGTIEGFHGKANQQSMQIGTHKVIRSVPIHTISYVCIDRMKGRTSFLEKIRLNNCILKLNQGLFIADCELNYTQLYDNLIKVYFTGVNGLYSNMQNNIMDNSGLYDLYWSWLLDNNYSNKSTRYSQVSNTLYGPSEPSIYTDTITYYGTACEHIARRGIWDMENPFNPTGFGYVDLSNMRTRPHPECHGIVWKVVVNGYDAQDEFEQLPPLGVGTHKFEVYFNRKMKESAVPNISMGVRPPYTQTAIAENGTWSEYTYQENDTTDVTVSVYTAYLTITGNGALDGLNRIYVDGAQDLENFEIPVENMRFNVQVSASGAMSAGFMAEAGLGKVNLTWENPEENFDDMLGYNMYRYTVDTLGVASDTIRINTRLLEPEEVVLTDYDVVPGTTYYYYYKVLRTNMTENSPSLTVAATPLTASKGDANGSMSIDVADVVTEIAYLTNQNPQPFIFEAADVNSDEAVNILDVVGTLNIIITPADASAMIADNAATYSIEDGILYIESPVALGGVQLLLNTTADKFEAMDALSGFELVTSRQDENSCLVLAYSMSGRSIATGRQAILKIGDAAIDEIILSDTRGKNVLAANADISGIGSIEAMQMSLPYPNPFTVELSIPYIIGQSGDNNVKIMITDLAGRTVNIHETVQDLGKYVYTWTPDESVADGVYFVSLYVNDTLMQTAKVVKE